ncbi:TPA: hypothetical protein DCL37_02850 [Candidatus Acetothermia bacterium]|nr:hypothetical protein [Candidatus Acetothermia bacterium]
MSAEEMKILSEAGTAVVWLSIQNGRKAIWAMAFDASSKVSQDDFVLYGLSDVSQPPQVDGTVTEGEYPVGIGRCAWVSGDPGVEPPYRMGR